MDIHTANRYSFATKIAAVGYNDGVTEGSNGRREKTMKLKAVQIENYRAIRSLTLNLDPQLTVLHGANGCGKTSILTAIALAFAPSMHAAGRRVDLDRQIGGLPYPKIQLVGDSGEVLSRVEANHLAEAAGGIGWGHINERGQFIPGEAGTSANLLPFVFYDIDRAVVSSLKERDVGTEVDYNQLFEWFYASENDELRRRERDDPNATLGDLDAVRRAVCSMIPGASEPRIEMRPPRFVVSLADRAEFSLEQLSDGYQNVLALAADIAWQMAVQHEAPAAHSPHTEALVLIDEIELHLHPRWQQHVLPDLMRTFPNAQFVVSTHSPQVLSTIRPRHILELAPDDDNVVAEGAASATYGAEAGDVLTCVMGVETRPDNRFTQELGNYRRLISDDRGETEEAQRIRKTLDELSPQDPALDDADLEIRQRGLYREPRNAQCEHYRPALPAET